MAEPPLTLKLKFLPTKAGVSLSLQILRSPKLPPAGWLTNVTRDSLATVLPTGTFTTALRAARSELMSRALGVARTAATSVAGSLACSRMVALPPAIWIGPEHRPPFTVTPIAEPPLGVTVYVNVLPDMPFSDDLQSSSVPGAAPDARADPAHATATIATTLIETTSRSRACFEVLCTPDSPFPARLSMRVRLTATARSVRWAAPARLELHRETSETLSPNRTLGLFVRIAVRALPRSGGFAGRKGQDESRPECEG